MHTGGHNFKSSKIFAGTTIVIIVAVVAAVAVAAVLVVVLVVTIIVRGERNKNNKNIKNKASTREKQIDPEQFPAHKIKPSRA